LRLNFSEPNGGSRIEIGCNTNLVNVNYIDIGTLTTVVTIAGLPYNPFSYNTGVITQVASTQT
jgi:hypothetical protein